MQTYRLLCAGLALCSCLIASSFAWSADGKRIVLLAGNPSHGYGSHEHLAGCRILAEAIERSAPGVQCDVIGGGWPEDDARLEGADAIVMYCDGGGGHPALKHLATLEKHIQRGAGFVCLHYGVEVPEDKGGPEFLRWLGGYFEANWSVNPHWNASFSSFPDHPVTRGVTPFEANDEWYFHMRFRPEMQGITPILSAVPPASTMSRPDGPHSGNPAVRAEVAKGLPQHMAWVYERPDGGRSFGFTGGHFHWNWGRPEIIRLVTNAICWTAKVDIPAGGLKVDGPSIQTLQEGQDEPMPEKFDAQKIKEEFKLTSSGTAVGSASSKNPSTQPQQTKPNSNSRSRSAAIFTSPVITAATKEHRVDAEVDLRGVKKLFLVVTDGGDGFTSDWADWLQPTLVKEGKQQDLTELKWSQATSQWGEVSKNHNAAGQELKVGGKSFKKGIGTHANSVISFDLDGSWEKLKVGCGLDEGGSSQNGGAASSIQFAVYANSLPTNLNLGDLGNTSSSAGEAHAAENAVAGLTVHPELELTLAASEPTLMSLTNLDIDHRGRVWVCEVVNYRRHNGERPEGDRILILEDTDQDGVMDKQKVFYQGRDIDSAMGICVLGNRVIVSSSPNVWMFTDDDGDDVADRKELFFSKTGDPQHDHSAHSFSFGPDGKLYWNFGNTGHSVSDAKGEIVRDLAGNEVRDDAKPYRQGMPFRCNLDGSQFEVLGHNFRNNYEVAVDSFGAVWQSDNDDDGNRATRINFVMEFGNYGYVDEMTGSAWSVERTNMESEIPQRHWHLNDPGVVPTMLITGAGSPTGIAVYEGDLLPAVFRNQIIHCDAGPNVVRAYPAAAEGAGYTADIVDMIVGERDRWFRPADVCTAPDGSVFVTDWYDPGVGGHNMQDMERGRLFRLAPPGTKYAIPKFDFATPEGAAAALTNACGSVRYLAFEALQKFGESSVASLMKLAQDENPRMRARAIWALGKLPAHGAKSVTLAMQDRDENVRMVAIRLARQIALPTSAYAGLLSDPSPAVRREFAVALHLDKSSEAPQQWAKLAGQYDGQDRWMLEALGIGAQRRWGECLDAYSESIGGKFDTPASRDIAWRARAPKAAQLIASFLLDPRLADSEVPKFVRALDFQAASDRETAIESLLAKVGSAKISAERQERLIVECLLRSPSRAAKPDPAWLQSVAKYWDRSTDRSEQLKIVQQLKLPNAKDLLLKLVVSGNADSQSVAAAEMLISQGANDAIFAVLSNKDAVPQAERLSTSLGLSKLEVSGQFVESVLATDEILPEAKTELAKSLAQSDAGAKLLLARAKQGTLPTGARLIVGSRLRASNNAEVRAAALELFPAPIGAAKAVLPPLNELLSRRGDVARGIETFKLKGTCANCHIVSNVGKNVGPDLTEIGGKLSREAMLVSILDPSAGISQNFENFAALTNAGQVFNGLLISRTDDQVVIKDAQGIERTIPAAELEQLKKLDKSLMPDNLHESLSADELVDLLEYLMTLKKK